MIRRKSLEVSKAGWVSVQKKEPVKKALPLRFPHFFKTTLLILKFMEVK